MSLSSRLLQPVVALATAAVVAASPAVAAAAPVYYVQQGQRIAISDGYCTLGFNDPVTGKGITAAHCGEAEPVRVSLVKADGTQTPPIGTITRSTRYFEHAIANDWATIEWDSNVRVLPNKFSGDKRISVEDVERDDKICFHGYTSHGDTNDYTCGTYMDRLGNTIFVSPERRVEAGDSGGPAWIPGKGFLGVLSAGTIEATGPLTEVVLTVPEDGPVFNQMAEGYVIGSALGSADLSSTPPGERSSENESSLATMGGELDAWVQVVIFGLIGIAVMVGWNTLAAFLNSL